MPTRALAFKGAESISEAAVAEFFGQEEFILAHDLTARQDWPGGLETHLFADVA